MRKETWLWHVGSDLNESQLPCSQHLRLHGWTSSDLEFGTSCEPAPSFVISPLTLVVGQTWNPPWKTIYIVIEKYFECIIQYIAKVYPSQDRQNPSSKTNIGRRSNGEISLVNQLGLKNLEVDQIFISRTYPLVEHYNITTLQHYNLS